MSEKIKKELTNLRPSKSGKKLKPFIEDEGWEKHWWGMPEFEMKDTTPQYKMTLNFMTYEDMKKFNEVTGIRATPTTQTIWYPEQPNITPGKYFYTGKKSDSKYPICIPSKGRADNQRTGKILDRIGVSYKFFVENTEYEEYVEHLGKDKVVKLPFNNLGKGSVPARNYIWKWCKKRGHKRHWTLDDNIRGFGRTNFNRRLMVWGGKFFKAMEDFVDRYENIPMAGPHHVGFIPDRGKCSPYLFNSRVYSCILLDTSLYPKFKWRGRYNEDTDLSLRLLKAGYCTLLFRALWMMKTPTHIGGEEKTTPSQKGGNTDNVYNTNDHRLAFAKSLEKQHPDCVKVVWKFRRWHHQVDYSKFKRNKPKLKEGVVSVVDDNNYGMELTKKSKKKRKKKIKIKRRKNE